MSEHTTLDPLCIVKQGYLIKSPPMAEATIIRKRWRMRWFLLYDTQARCEIDPALEREVDLYYYKSDKHVVEGAPKGSISLKDVQIYGQRGRLHGYDHVINIQTNNRLYHLCATQIFVYNSWLDKLRERYVPYQELHLVERPRCTSCGSQSHDESRRKSAPDVVKAATHKNLMLSKSFHKADNRNNDGDSDDDSDGDRYDYAYEHCSLYSVSEKSKPMRAQTERRHNPEIRSWLDETSIPKYVPPKATQTSSCETDEEDETDYIGMGEIDETDYVEMGEIDETDYVGMADLTIPPESEDEGIGRTDSDSSNVSVTTTDTKERIPSYKSRQVPRDSLYLKGFVGPKLSCPASKGKQLTRAASLGDVSTYTNFQTVRTNHYEF